VGRPTKVREISEVLANKRIRSFPPPSVFDNESLEYKFPIYAVGGIIRGLVPELYKNNKEIHEYVVQNLIEYVIQECGRLQDNPQLLKKEGRGSENRRKAEYIAQGIPSFLNSIRRSFPHPPEVLQLQSTLIHYWTVKFPFKARNSMERQIWINENLEEMLHHLKKVEGLKECIPEAGIFCDKSCPRKTELPTGESLSEFIKFHKPAALRNLILAHLHGLSPTTVQKLLYGRQSRATTSRSK